MPGPASVIWTCTPSSLHRRSASTPPGVTDDPAFMRLLAQAAANKPTNPDIYTAQFADFVETFSRVLGDPALPHLFFIEGGALAVENALKCAFDWKSRHNEMRG